MSYDLLTKKKLPKQDRERLMLLLDRWDRAAGAHAKWAETAKKCVDAVEGRQWDQTALRALIAEHRPALTINQINRLVRLILGYFSNNRTDIKYLAGHDGTGDDGTADCITSVVKTISELSQLPYIDTEVFMDGITTGRGYFDSRVCFENNDFGEGEFRAADPFSVYLDPDGQNYDLNDGCGFICQARMGSLDEIEYLYGKEARENVEPFANGRTPMFSYALHTLADEISPIRRFGNSENSDTEWWDSVYSRLGSFYDPLRKSLRIMDFQYQERVEALLFVDLETGDTRPIPDEWKPDRIKKVLWWAKQNATPLTVDRRSICKYRWTTIIGDLMVYDRPSPYSTYTLSPYFPYFRRGVTRGMVEDLIDPQMEINKRRSARVDTIMRTAHSGWQYHENSLSPEQEAKLKLYGGEPGFNLKWKGDASMRPVKIEASGPATGLRELEDKGNEDLHEVSGINESALGQIDIGQSGRAIEARQRQAVVAIQTYFTNFSRTKELLGRKGLEIVQEHYTEQRVLRVLGADGKVAPPMLINQRTTDEATGAQKIINNVMLGKYRIVIDEVPLAASFTAAQFEEMLALMQKLGPLGQMLASIRPDLIIEMSSMPRKDEWKEALKQAAQNSGQPAVDPATQRLKDAQAYAAMGTGAANFAKAATTVQQGEMDLAALEAGLSGQQSGGQGANGGQGGSPPGPAGGGGAPGSAGPGAGQRSLVPAGRPPAPPPAGASAQPNVVAIR